MPGIEDLVRDYLRAGDDQDYRAVAATLHADVLTHSPGGVTTSGVDANLAAWQAAHRGLDRLRHRVVAVVASGGEAAARVEVSGVHTGFFLGIAPTGACITVDQALFVRRAGTRIVEMWEVVDTGSGLQQLGVLGQQDLSPG
jgi:predicted ester cyclase